MLALSPLTNVKDERENFSINEFSEFSDGNFLDSIDFDDLFVGINNGGVLPDLAMDSEILAEFSTSGSGGEESEMNTTSSFGSGEKAAEEDNCLSGKEGEVKASEEILSKRDDDESVGGGGGEKPLRKGAEKGRKSSGQSKSSQGKRKVKVDWTADLHRRFVQAVEQLGVDKAVPSRILELMGIDCLTRHNIASHLQKYRSHRKHLLAREAEASTWSQRRQMYGGATAAGGGSKIIRPWVAPTMGFPPPMPPLQQPFRPLHVWGHPSMDQSLMHMWPKHLAPASSPPHPAAVAWVPSPHPPPRPPPDPSFWHSYHLRVPNSATPACFPPPLATTRFPVLPVPGIPPLPHAMFRLDHSRQTGPHPPLDLLPSKESIDAAIGDAMSKPWLPLPLGLKPPSTDSVMVELQRQGIPKIPPTCG